MERRKTGQKCRIGGDYKFDGYVDPPEDPPPPPTPDEMVIPMEEGETFPPIKSTDLAAWWLLE